MKKIVTSLFLAVLCSIITANAQVRQVTGSVKDDKGVAVASATVKVKGQNSAIVADENGAFKINASATAVLQVSAVGFVSTEVSAKSAVLNVVLVRQEIGDVLRDFRLQKGRTLRQVAGKASVALGYLSEVERGQKEASSEILASVADALEVPISVIMRQVSDRLAALEGVHIPDTIPAEFYVDFNKSVESSSGSLASV